MTRDLRLLTLADGRQVELDDTGEPAPGAPVVVWHRGSPHTGALFEPLLRLARGAGLRMLTIARPAYGRSTPVPGRTVAAAAADCLEASAQLGIERLAMVSDSGGGPHALAAAALAPDRVAAVATFASPAPFVDAPVWWDGMADPGGLRAAMPGREARLRYAETAGWDPSIFTEADHAALAGDWAGLGEDAGASGTAGVVGLADDDLAFVRPWGVDLADVRAPVLLVQGAQDRVIPAAHADLIAAALPEATLRRRPGAGHVAVLEAVPEALAWVAERLR